MTFGITSQKKNIVTIVILIFNGTNFYVINVFNNFQFQRCNCMKLQETCSETIAAQISSIRSVMVLNQGSTNKSMRVRRNADNLEIIKCVLRFDVMSMFTCTKNMYIRIGLQSSYALTWSRKKTLLSLLNIVKLPF